MASRASRTAVLGLLALGTGCVVLLFALYLGFSIEATSRAIANSAKGHRIAVPAVVAVVAGALALVVRRRRGGPVVAWVGVAAAIVAVLLAVLIPGGQD